MTSLDHERRILELETHLWKVMEAARELATIMRGNTDSLDDALTVAEAWESNRKRRETGYMDHAPAYPVKGWVPAVVELEKVIAEASGIDNDDEWYAAQQARERAEA